MYKILTIISFLVITSCTTIQEYENLTQETDVLLSTSVNGVIFKVQKEKDLPNVFGRKDVWGGMVDQGEKVLRFMGLNQNGNLVLRLADIDIKSNQNVFTRIGMKRAQLLPENVYEFEFDHKQNKLLDLGYITVSFENVTAYSIRYILNE
jgi:hypothetical protein